MTDKTCKDCTEFNHKRQECGCPLNAYPSWDSYVYANTTEDTKACGFFFPIKVVKE